MSQTGDEPVSWDTGPAPSFIKLIYRQFFLKDELF